MSFKMHCRDFFTRERCMISFAPCINSRSSGTFLEAANSWRSLTTDSASPKVRILSSFRCLRRRCPFLSWLHNCCFRQQYQLHFECLQSWQVHYQNLLHLQPYLADFLAYERSEIACKFSAVTSCVSADACAGKPALRKHFLTVSGRIFFLAW